MKCVSFFCAGGTFWCIQKPRAENGPLSTLLMNVVAPTLWMLVRLEAANKAWLQSGVSVVTRMNSVCLRRACDSCDVHFSEQEAGACAFKSRAQKKLSRRDCVCIELTPGGAIFFSLHEACVCVHQSGAQDTFSPIRCCRVLHAPHPLARAPG